MGYSNNIYNFMKEQENEKEWYLEKRKEYNELKEIIASCFSFSVLFRNSIKIFFKL